MDVKTVKYLKNIKGVLKKIMGDTTLGGKYVRALDVAIQSLTTKEVSLITKDFVVSAQNIDEGIIVDVYHNKTGKIIESIEMDEGDIIDDGQSGEA